MSLKQVVGRLQITESQVMHFHSLLSGVWPTDSWNSDPRSMLMFSGLSCPNFWGLRRLSVLAALLVQYYFY